MTDILDAAYFGELDNIRTLLDDGADVNISGQDGNTPLHMAVLGGHTNCVALLIKKKANVCAVNSAGSTNLHLAVTTAQLECIKLLLEAGAPVNSRNNSGDTPLDYAIDQIVSYTIPEDIERHLTLIDFLLQFGADARYAHNALIRNYQPRRLGPGTKERRWYSSKYRRAILEKLLNFGLEAGWTDENGDTLLHVLCGCGAPSDDINQLLKNGFDVNARNHVGDTPLLVYLNRQYLPPRAGMMALIYAKADINAINDAGQTPIQIVKAWSTYTRLDLKRLQALYTALIDCGADESIGTALNRVISEEMTFF